MHAYKSTAFYYCYCPVNTIVSDPFGNICALLAPLLFLKCMGIGKSIKVYNLHSKLYKSLVFIQILVRWRLLEALAIFQNRNRFSYGEVTKVSQILDRHFQEVKIVL